MCFDKKNAVRPPTISMSDMYVLKSTPGDRINSAGFNSAAMRFTYVRGQKLTKNVIRIFVASFKKHLEHEVFHTYSRAKSLRILNGTGWPHNREDAYGVFRIPSFTPYWENGDAGEFACASIEYVGPLDEWTKVLLTDPVNYSPKPPPEIIALREMREQKEDERAEIDKIIKELETMLKTKDVVKSVQKIVDENERLKIKVGSISIDK